MEKFKYMAVSRKASHEAGFEDTQNEKELVLAGGEDEAVKNIARRYDEVFLRLTGKMETPFSSGPALPLH